MMFLFSRFVRRKGSVFTFRSVLSLWTYLLFTERGTATL